MRHEIARKGAKAQRQAEGKARNRRQIEWKSYKNILLCALAPWRAISPLCILLSLLVLGRPLVAQEDARSSLEVTSDEDGDVAVVMDTESIRMAVLPAYQSCISSFIFKPTGNDILSRMSIKYLMGGQGLLQDNFWEQDWRFSEFRHKWYDFKIVSQGPDELAASFWTTSVGWLQADNSGVISELISNIKIERTIRMPAGKPYFLCDVTLSIDREKDVKGHAKLPQFWMHNMSLFTDDLSDEYQRPHTLGIAEQTKSGKTVTDDFVYIPTLAEGWSAQTSPNTKEGIVYLMDPSYVQSLYNCGNTTLEWFADNMLITKDRPLQTRIYILPVIGLDKVHFADPHMILRLTPQLLTEGEHKGALSLEFAVSPSYKQIRSITFETWATYGLHERQHQKVRMTDPQPVVRNLRVESPQYAAGVVQREDGAPFTAQTPVKFDITAHVELLDSEDQLVTQDVHFQYFHLAAYPTGRNEHLQGGEPLAVLDRVDARPWIPTPDADLQVNRQEFKIFALAGPHFRHFHLPRAIEKLTSGGARATWNPVEDIGYSVGFPTQANGLTNFPYDFDRLFQYRLIINCNSQTDLTRLVGQSILAGYFQRGGGYLSLGGESAFAVAAPAGHALHAFEPIAFRPQSIHLPEDHRPAQLKILVPEHPIFKGNGGQAKAIDLAHPPQALSWHDLKLKTETRKPLLASSNAPLALDFNGAPAAFKQAVEQLPAERRPTRDEHCQHCYQALSDATRRALDEVCAKVFHEFPGDALKDGVFAAAHAPRVKEEQQLDIRAALFQLGDDQKELVNAWLDANFAQANRIYLQTLPPELQSEVQNQLTAALAGKGRFVRDGAWLLPPPETSAALAKTLQLQADELPLVARPRVLIELDTPHGPRPFLVEVEALQPDPQNPTQLIPNPNAGRALALLSSPFGAKEEYPAGTLPYWEWDQWDQLLTNLLLYTGKEY